MGMRTIIESIPAHVIGFIEKLRQQLCDVQFSARHRVRPEDFTRQRQLTFPIVMLFVLQKTVKSIQRHLHEFLNELTGGQLFEAVTAGAFRHARAKLKHTGFIELNQSTVLPAVYGPEQEPKSRRWRGHRLLGVDSSLLRLPQSRELLEEFGAVEVSNQLGHTGTTYPQARMSVLYDLLNRIGLGTVSHESSRSQQDGEVAGAGRSESAVERTGLAVGIDGAFCQCTAAQRRTGGLGHQIGRASCRE